MYRQRRFFCDKELSCIILGPDLSSARLRTMLGWPRLTANGLCIGRGSQRALPILVTRLLNSFLFAVVPGNNIYYLLYFNEKFCSVCASYSLYKGNITNDGPF